MHLCCITKWCLLTTLQVLHFRRMKCEKVGIDRNYNSLGSRAIKDGCYLSNLRVLFQPHLLIFPQP